MIYEDFPISYDKICSNVRHTLIDYDNYESNIPRKEIEQSLKKMYSKQKGIREKLDIAESNAMQIVGNWESFNQWFSVLKETNQDMIHKEIEDETELGRLRLAFSSNANQLKSLENDILTCCRKLPDTKESPEFIRLKCVYSKAKEYFNERTQVLAEISEEVSNAEKKFENTTNENAKLTQESLDFEKQLAVFANSESFKLVQEARKHRLIEKEWNEKKCQLLIDIEKSTKELENYLGNKDQSQRSLTLESNKQDQEEIKLKNKYKEMMQEVINEDNISNTNRTTVMKQLNIELERLQQTQLRKETSTTRSEVRTLKNKGDRLATKLKMEVSNSSRTFSQSLSKLTEPKPNTNQAAHAKKTTSNAPRNIKGKRKKSVSKKDKKSTEQKVPLQPPPPPPRVFSLQELGLMKLEEDKQKYTLFLQSKFEPEIAELRNYLERKVNINKELLQHELLEIQNANKRQQEILLANKNRINQRITEKDIEISSLNAELATFEDMIIDYSKNCEQLEKRNEELKRKSLDVIDPSKFIELRKSIESLNSFISSSKEAIDFLTAKMETQVENSNQGKIQNNEIVTFKNIPRSKSMNDLCIIENKTDRKKTDGQKKSDEHKKCRTDSALSYIFNKKEPIIHSSTPEPAPFTSFPHSSITETRENIEKVNINKYIEKVTPIDINNKPAYEIQAQIKISSSDINCTVVETVQNLEEEETSYVIKEPDEKPTKKPTNSIPNYVEFKSENITETDHSISFTDAQTDITENHARNKPPPIITNVETETPSLNVTQPPNCQSPVSKPQSQLQLQPQPPCEQVHFIRKAPTDTRAFTIEAHVSSGNVESLTHSGPIFTSSSPRHTLTKVSAQPVNQTHQKVVLNVTPRESFDAQTFNTISSSSMQMIEKSSDSYRIVGDSDNLQLKEGKSSARNLNPISKQPPSSRRQKKQTKQKSEQLVLLAVTPACSDGNKQQSAQNAPNKMSLIANTTVRRKRGASATKELQSTGNRFVIYADDTQKSLQQAIMINPRRREIFEHENTRINQFSTYVKRSTNGRQRIENRVQVTKQKRRNSSINPPRKY